MNRLMKSSLRVSLFLLVCFILPRGAGGTVDDAQSFALQAAEPYVKEGFQVREDYWGGDLGSGEKKAVRQQLFKMFEKFVLHIQVRLRQRSMPLGTRLRFASDGGPNAGR